MHGSTKFVRAIGVLLLLGGIAIFGLTAIMNYLQGEMWAVTESGKLVNRWSSVIIDAVGIVVIGFAAGAAFAARKRGWGIGLTLIMLLSAVASINSMASFQATERMSASKTREAHLDRVKDADKLQADSAKDALKLAGKNADDKGARRDFVAANKDAIKAFRDAKVEVQVAPDAGAELWATLSGWSLDRIQMIQSAYLAILLIILKMVCFQSAGFFLNPLAWRMKASDVKVSGSSEGGGNDPKKSDGSNDKQPATIAPKDEKVVPIRAATVVQQAESVGQPAQFQTPPKVSSGLSPAPRPPVSLTLQPKRYASVTELLASQPGASLPQVEIAKALKVSEAKVSRDVKRLAGQGRVKVDRNGRTKNITLAPRRIGGFQAIGH